jgi:hypothetical protein
MKEKDENKKREERIQKDFEKNFGVKKKKLEKCKAEKVTFAKCSAAATGHITSLRIPLCKVHFRLYLINLREKKGG